MDLSICLGFKLLERERISVFLDQNSIKCNTIIKTFTPINNVWDNWNIGDLTYI